MNPPPPEGEVLALTLEGVSLPALVLNRLPLQVAHWSLTCDDHSDLEVGFHPVHPVLQACHSISDTSLTSRMLRMR